MKVRHLFFNPYYQSASGYSFLFFISWSLWWSFYAIWLKNNIGLSSVDLGIVYSLNQFTSTIFMILYGVIQDKLGLKKHLIWLISIILILTGPFFIYVYEPLLKSHFIVGLFSGAIFFGMGFLAGCGLLDSFIEKMSRAFHFEFGECRSWGSLGYAIGTLVAGILFVSNPHLNFWLVSCCGLLFLCCNLSFKSNHASAMQKEADKITKEDFLSILRDSNFWFFVLYVIGSWSFYNIYDQQMFPVFYVSLFENTEDATRIYGILNSVQVLLEAVFMAFIPIFVNKIGAKNALMVGGVIMTCRIILSAFFIDPYIISFVKLLHALEVPLCVISVFKYSAVNFDKRLSATIFLIGFQIASALGVVVLSTPIGRLVDVLGYQPIFFLIAAIVFIVLLVGVFTLNKSRKEEDNAQFENQNLLSDLQS